MEANMSIKRFELSRKCNQAAKYSLALKEECRPFVMYRILERVCNDLTLKDQTLSAWERRLSDYQDIIMTEYKDEWFSLIWQKAKAVDLDMEYIRRFLSWFLSQNAGVVEANVPIFYPYEGGGLTGCVQLIYQAGGITYGAFLHYGKTKKSMRGKSEETNIAYDLSSMIAKSVLEEMYPNIRIVNLYLQTEADIEGVVGPDFIIDATKKSQYFCIGYENYYDADGKFLKEDFASAIQVSLQTPKKKDCNACPYKEQCSDETVFTELENEYVEEPEKKKTANEFTPCQLRAIQKEGATLICAGPGSGKTATLVGKIRYLIEEKGVPAPFILMLSFTNEVVREMKERVSEFSSEDMPTISTINGLAYTILRDVRSRLGLEKIGVLTDTELKRMIEAHLNAVTSLDSINLFAPLNGKYGLLNTLSRYYWEYVKDGEEAFFAPNKHVKCGPQVRELLQNIKEEVALRGLITFDEQITKCVEILKEHPEILNEYQNTYQYMLVDEYQDVNASQAELVYLLAEPQNNLTVVGDDDQSIYGFRQASSKYMLEFEAKFGCKAIVLDKNFRSDSGLVRASGQVIQKSTKERIEKKVTAVSIQDSKPIFVHSDSPEVLDRVIQKILSEGYRYGDIALLARTNDELLSLKESLKVPSVLGKNFIVKSPLFRFLYQLITYFETDSEKALYELFFLVGLKEYALSSTADALKQRLEEEEADKKVLYLKNAITGIGESWKIAKTIEHSAVFFFESFCGYLGLSENTPFYDGMMGILDLYDITSLKDFYERMKLLKEFDDKTKLSLGGSIDSVFLLTFHEAKGMEFPAVILLDDGKSNYEDEALNVFYVGLTRARKKAYLLSKRYLAKFEDVFERIEPEAV